MQYYLAIDIGASSGRHILAHLEKGKMYTEEIYRFANGPVEKIGYDGKPHLVWETERLFQEILNGLKKAGELGKIPRYIGIDILRRGLSLPFGYCPRRYGDLRQGKRLPPRDPQH